MDNNYSDKKSRAGWTENIKDKKKQGHLKRRQKKKLSGQKLSGQKGIYHQVEFRRIFTTDYPCCFNTRESLWLCCFVHNSLQTASLCSLLRSQEAVCLLERFQPGLKFLRGSVLKVQWVSMSPNAMGGWVMLDGVDLGKNSFLIKVLTIKIIVHFSMLN